MVTRTHDSRMAGVGDIATRIRKTAKGELLIELKKSSGTSLTALKEQIGSVLGGGLPIRTVSPQTTFIIRDLDELVTREELTAELASQANFPPGSVTIKSIRTLASGGQVATFSVPETVAGSIKSLGRVKVGWTRCRNKEIEAPALWSFGNTPKRMADVHSERGCVRAKMAAWWMYSVYLAPSMSLEEFGDAVDRLATDARGHTPCLIAGNFNAWAVNWGSSLTNARGRTLLEAFSTLDGTLLNTGAQPTFSRAGANPVVDLTFVSCSRASQCTWVLSDIYT
ncbi:hypothetical protein KR059_012178, partial [Drosophila kikkawai]